MGIQGLETYTRLPGFGFGWSNFVEFVVDDYYYESMSIARQLSLSAGQKVKMQIRVLNGNDVNTAPESCRLLIKKA